MAAEVGKAVSDSMREDETGYREAARVAVKIRRASDRSRFPLDIHIYTEQFTARLAMLFDPESDNRVEEIEEIIKYKDDLNPLVREDLVATLKVLEGRVKGFLEALTVAEEPTTRTVKAKVNDSPQDEPDE